MFSHSRGEKTWLCPPWARVGLGKVLNWVLSQEGANLKISEPYNCIHSKSSLFNRCRKLIIENNVSPFYKLLGKTGRPARSCKRDQVTRCEQDNLYRWGLAADAGTCLTVWVHLKVGLVPKGCFLRIQHPLQWMIVPATVLDLPKRCHVSVATSECSWIK